MTRGEDARRHPRLPVALRVRMDAGKGELTALTRTVSRDGFDVRLPNAPGLNERFVVTLSLPDTNRVKANAVCRSRGAGDLCGFALELGPSQRALWDGFLDEEESTGSLWRMVARWARSRGEDNSGRTVTSKGPFRGLFGRGRSDAKNSEKKAALDDIVLRFHMVGENGEAYRVCFEKHASTPAKESDLTSTLEGFSDLAEHALTRVLDAPVHVRLFEDGEPFPVRVCEQKRGGYAWVQGEGEDASAPVGLVSLGAGEVLLVEVDGEPVFPFLSDDELERIACDTFRHDLQRPMFTPSGKQRAAPGIAVKEPDGIAGVVVAQQGAALVQRRSYGEREIDLFPEVWARAVDENGSEVLGPTMRDGERALLLALVGTGAPRVVKLESASDVSLLGRRRKSA